MTRLAITVGLAAALLGLAFFYGRKTMDDEWQANTLQKTVETLRERKATNDKIKALSDADLCRALGGMPNEQGGCL